MSYYYRNYVMFYGTADFKIDYLDGPDLITLNPFKSKLFL